MSQSIKRFPTKGLRLWLTSSKGIQRREGRVNRWMDQSGHGRDASQSDVDRCPTFLPNAFNGKPALGFDGVDDYLIFSPLRLNGLEEITIILVSANWRFAENEQWGDEGGPHGTVNAALLFEEEGEGDVWGCVYLSPFQNRVSMRFGTGQVNNVNLWVRPESIGERPSITVAVKRGTNEELYVDGTKVAAFTDKRRSIANTASTGWLGRGRVDTYGPFELSEVLMFDRAIRQQEMDEVFRTLGTRYSIKLAR